MPPGHPPVTALALVEAAIPALRRYAWALLRNGPAADDLVQDCLVRALDRLPDWRGGDVRPWLFAIMHNLHVSRWRRLRRFPTVTVDAEAPAFRVEAGQTHHVELQAVLRALDALAAEQRDVLLLVTVEGLDYADAAHVLGIPVGTVMSRLSRGRDRLRRLLDEPGTQAAPRGGTGGGPGPVLRRVK